MTWSTKGIGDAARELERQQRIEVTVAPEGSIPIPNSSDRCKECGDIFATHVHSGVAGGHTFKA